jgi:lysophospholipase L1-like esterase
MRHRASSSRRVALLPWPRLLALALLLLAAQASAKDPQLVPNRLASTGDSITEAINAEEFNPFIIETPNHWASFVNGYHGFWESFFGRTDVNSHNQRISDVFGDEGRTNFINALSGANSGDLSAQAAATVSQQATYTTLFMGHNDVCDDTFAGIPTDAEFEANVRAALDPYQAGLPDGATVYIIGLVDIYSLWQLGDELDALGIIPCELIWATTLLELFPCATMLSPANSEADRQFTRGRNIAFNQILENLAFEYQANDPHHYYVYSDDIFQIQFISSQVSDFDCFHPSARGQRDLATATWSEEMFALPEPSGTLPTALALLYMAFGAERRRRVRQRATK